MNPYIAPLEEIRFLLTRLTDIKSVAEIVGAEALEDQDLTDAILEQAARFSQEVLAPLDMSADREGAKWDAGEVTTPKGFKDAYKQFIESGWNNVAIPEEYGGQGLPTLMSAPLNEMFVSSNKSFCYCTGLSQSGVKALISAASEEQKKTFLPRLVSGEWTATMNLTEPQAGSDVGALRTRAVPQDDGSYRIFGQKIFISYGEHDLSENIVHLVLARLPDAPAGSKGISLFVVPKYLPDTGERNDLSCAGIEHKLGNHGSPTCTMVYGEKGLGATGWMIGEENRGLNAMFVMVNSARFNVGMEGVSSSEKAYQQAVAYAHERIQGRLVGGKESVKIVKHPDVRRMLLMMRSQTEAMRALAYVIAEARDIEAKHPDQALRREKSGLIGLLTPVFKGWASETANETTSMAMQVFGGMGYIEESGVPQTFRDTRISSIYEGTTAIQAHDFIERKVVKDGAVVFRAWSEQVQHCLSELEGINVPELAGIHSNLKQAVEAMVETVHWAAEHYSDNTQEVLSGAVPLLKLVGIVAGGWVMARSAIAAYQMLRDGEGNSVFLQRKLQSARFFSAHVVPEVLGLAVIAKGAGESTLALGDEAFAI